MIPKIFQSEFPDMAYSIDISLGDAAPYFRQRSPSNESYSFDSAAGRYLVLCFFGSAGEPHSQKAIEAVQKLPSVFDDKTASFFGVCVDPSDEEAGRTYNRIPGYRTFWDFDLSVSKLYGAADTEAVPNDSSHVYRRFWVVIDPTMRVMRVFGFKKDLSDIPEVMNYLQSLPPPNQFAGFEVNAPILVLPNVFEESFCRHLIGLYEADGGTESGFVREIDGKTVGVTDHSHKSRRDYNIEDASLISDLRARFLRRVIPEIAKVHQYHVTRMERYIVACYSEEDGGHFRPHRDNTTKGTAHRRFAVSVNLNDDFDGGEVSFPEYGPRSYKAPAGGAVVFSCSLLHAVSKVTRGRRYAFLPFLYDDAAAEIRQQNNAFLGENIGAYKGGGPREAQA
ncbi:hypothetical protein GCM10010973_36950 [Cribrihabitans marinus]|nr:hypothetical protein GCM10010973_36950 [Cribrihabitans marinus]